MPHRRIMIVAAFLGLFLTGTGGCARSEFNRQRQSRESERPCMPITGPGARVRPSQTSAYRSPLQPPRFPVRAMNETRPMPKRLPLTNQPDDEELVEKAANVGSFPRTSGDGGIDELVDRGLDIAFQRLHETREKMPRRPPVATSRDIPPPATRVASPFAKAEQNRSGSVR